MIEPLIVTSTGQLKITLELNQFTGFTSWITIITTLFAAVSAFASLISAIHSREAAFDTTLPNFTKAEMAQYNFNFDSDFSFRLLNTGGPAYDFKGINIEINFNLNVCPSQEQIPLQISKENLQIAAKQKIIKIQFYDRHNRLITATFPLRIDQGSTKTGSLSINEIRYEVKHSFIFRILSKLF